MKKYAVGVSFIERDYGSDAEEIARACCEDDYADTVYFSTKLPIDGSFVDVKSELMSNGSGSNWLKRYLQSQVDLGAKVPNKMLLSAREIPLEGTLLYWNSQDVSLEGHGSRGRLVSVKPNAIYVELNCIKVYGDDEERNWSLNFIGKSTDSKDVVKNYSLDNKKGVADGFVIGKLNKKNIKPGLNFLDWLLNRKNDPVFKRTFPLEHIVEAMFPRLTVRQRVDKKALGLRFSLFYE